MKVADKTPSRAYLIQEARRKQSIIVAECILVFVSTFLFGFLARNLF